METEKAKRKTKTSTAVKARYNEKVYDVISARVPKELAGAFPPRAFPRRRSSKRP